MDANIQLSSLLVIVGAISSVVGAWLKIRGLAKDYRKERSLETAKILQEAKEGDSKLKIYSDSKREMIIEQFNAKIQALETRLENLENSVAKDFAHVRETYNGEIRVLGDKIEDLRTELRTQHGQLITMLTKMIDSRN